jgi:hypothetical protein
VQYVCAAGAGRERNTCWLRCACAQREYIINRWRCCSYRYPPLHLSLHTCHSTQHSHSSSSLLSCTCCGSISHRRHAHDGTPSLSLSLSLATSPRSHVHHPPISCACVDGHDAGASSVPLVACGPADALSVYARACFQSTSKRRRRAYIQPFTSRRRRRRGSPSSPRTCASTWRPP